MSIFQPLAASPESATAIWAAKVEPAPAASASALPSKRAEIVFFIFFSVGSAWRRCSDAEIGVKLIHVALQLRVGKAIDDLAVLDNVVAVGHRGGEPEILFDQKDRKTFLLEPRDGVADLLDDDRRKPLGRLVQHQKPRAGTQDSRDRKHLLLAARQFGALAVEPFLEIGKQFEDLIQRQAARMHDRRQQQIFADIDAV